MKVFAVSVPVALIEALEVKAKQRGLNKSQATTEAIRRYVSGRK